MTGDRTYKFQGLQVYQLALDYLDKVYELARDLPEEEKYNLKSQLVRAATSIVLNIAEGSTGQSDPEQSRFVSMALRSYLETIACFDIAERRQFLSSHEQQQLRESGRELFAKLSALRRALGRPLTMAGGPTDDGGPTTARTGRPSPVAGPRSSVPEPVVGPRSPVSAPQPVLGRRSPVKSRPS